MPEGYRHLTCHIARAIGVDPSTISRELVRNTGARGRRLAGSGVNTSSSKCAGTQNAVSAMIDYRLLKRLDIYGGVMYSQVNGGLASGFLHDRNIAPTIGMRLQF
jgi:hypothetical protein